MKTITQLLLFTCLCTAFEAWTAEPPATGAPTNDAPSAPATNVMATSDQPPPPPTPPAAPAANAEVTNAASATVCVTNTAAGTNALGGTNAVAAAPTPPPEPPVIVENGTNGLRLNFHNAPLNLVLDYLSDAAGFIINREADVRGMVDVQGKNLTKEEAVTVLNSALKRNGYAVRREGRVLTIIAQDTAKTGDLPIQSGNDPEAVDKGAEMVTQIIPVKYASVTQLVPNLELLLPTSATLSANESANSLILVATKTDIKRMLTIISALDTSIGSSIKVFPLKFADAKDTATLITTLFAPQGGGATANNGRPNFLSMFGRGMGGFGGPGGFGGFGGRGGGSSGSSSSSGSAAAKNVVAVGDDRSNSIIVSAPSDLLATIEATVKEIDTEVTDVTELQVFRLVNADPSETADQIAALFPDPTTSTSGSQQGSTPFSFFGRFSRSGSGNTSAPNSSERAKKISRVLAVPDPRTSSIIVLASKTLMPDIAQMITTLDADKGRKEIVGYYDLQNADPQDVQNTLQDLFNRNNTMRNNNNNANTMLGQNNPLNKRVQQSTANSTLNGPGFGNSGTGRSSGGVSGF